MKKFILGFTALVLMAVNVSAAENFRAVLEPSTVMEGEAFMLQLSSDGKDQPELLEVPAGFTYQGSSQSTRIVNGKRSSTVGYQFAAPPQGTHKIPPLKVKLGDKQVKTPELVLQVVKDNSVGAGVEDVFARLELGGKRSKYYVGEEIPLSVNVYYPQKIRLQLAYPVLDIGKSIFRDFRSVNQENPSFAPVRRGRKVLDNKLFEEVRFTTAFRPLAPGKLTVNGKVNCNILIPEKRRSYDPFDDFWGGGINYRRIARQLNVQGGEITVLPLPPEPDNGFFLGLIGEYRSRIALSEESVNALEPVSLDITLESAGAFESLKVPEITLKDCRVYPGEVRRLTNGCVISYAIIPLKAGNMDIKCNFFYFDPVAGAYKNIIVNKHLQVKAAVGKSVASVPKITASVAAPGGEKAVDESLPPPPRTTLLYCKKAPQSAFYSFYSRNREVWALLFFIAGPVIWLLSIAAGRIRRKKADYGEIRRERAGAQRSALADKIRNAPAEDLPLLATGEVTDFLSDRWSLPAGSTPEDVAAACNDKALAEALRTCSNVSYLPRDLAKTAISDPENIRKLLLGALKVIVLMGSFFLLPTANAGGDHLAPANWHDALKAYDMGKYKAAKSYFEKYNQDNPSDANVYYNLGCIAEANGEPEMALWYLECSGLLAPHDSAAAENRNVMRGKFFLEPVGKVNNPLDAVRLCRDQLHPRDYLVLTAFCWMVFFILLSCRKKLPAAALWGIGTTLAAIMLIFLTMMFAQYSSIYRSNQALVVAKNAEIYTFPGVHNGKQLGSLPGGTPVDVVEEQTDYSLVRGRNLEGWTANKNIRKLLTE